jgi:hypothetical protein
LSSGTSNQAQARLTKDKAIHTNAALPPRFASRIESACGLLKND